ncbi:MAG: hypothetical protein M1508_00300 [Nitrospirae bacterium]|nr:hypothetical protein [Nitrospirota bacterium]
MASEKAEQIAASLISKRYLHKSTLKDLFIDNDLMEEVSTRLKAVGLEIATHVYTDYVSVRTLRECEQEVFNPDGKSYTASNLSLSKGAIALLVVIWAKIIMPKRQMQRERVSPAEEGQNHLFAESKPIPKERDMVAIDEKTLYADFAEKLGGKTKLGAYLSELARADLISRKNKQIFEGPLLDTIIDYPILAERIMNGALENILKTKGNENSPEGIPVDGDEGEADV